MAEYLLEHGADVNAQDKGGLIPLHNAASYGVSLPRRHKRAPPPAQSRVGGLINDSPLVFSPPQHVDIAALLIKYNTCVNATDKWAFTPLHEAAQKGRTQLCALLLAHGADPTMKNQEGQTALDLATVTTPIRRTPELVCDVHKGRHKTASLSSPQADDIRALLMDAMPPDALPSCFKPQATVVSASVISPASTPSCLSAASSIDNLAGPLTELAAAAAASGSSGVADGATGADRKEGESKSDASIVLSDVFRGCRCERRLNGVLSAVAMLDMNISQFLKSLGLEHLRDIFEREQVSRLTGTPQDEGARRCSDSRPLCRSPWMCWPTWATRS